MGGYSWTEIIAAFSLCVSAIVAGVPFLKWLSEQIEAKKKERKEKAEQKLHETLEFKRLENESEDAEWKRVTEMLKTSREEEERLRHLLAECREGSSLSGATITKIYLSFGKLEQAITQLEWMIAKEKKYDPLIIPMAILKERFEDLQQKLP